jgi:hypothetical protein
LNNCARFSGIPWTARLTGILLAAVALLLSPAHSAIAQSSRSQPSRQVQGFTPAPLDSGFGTLDASRPIGIAPAEIIQNFAAKESQFKRALENYTYRRTVKFDTIDEDNSVDGEYLQVDDIVFSSTGRKREMVVYAPENTLKRVSMSPADFDDIEHRLPFTLTTEDVGQYHLNYVGEQSVDQVATYVFDVAPKQIEKNRRYFVGRIWVDAHDYQIVVTNGKNIPDDTRPTQEDLSIPFTTYRQQIDGKYWFPVYTRADGVLHFTNCKQCLPEDDHIREVVQYGEYKRFGSDVHIIFDGVDIAEKSQPSPASGLASGPQTANYRSASGQLPDSGSSQLNATKE